VVPAVAPPELPVVPDPPSPEENTVEAPPHPLRATSEARAKDLRSKKRRFMAFLSVREGSREVFVDLSALPGRADGPSPWLESGWK
jgi:hypothetical protein